MRTGIVSGTFMSIKRRCRLSECRLYGEHCILKPVSMAELPTLCNQKKGIIIAKKTEFPKKKRGIFKHKQFEYSNTWSSEKKTARRHCLMLSGTQLITAQLLSSPSAIMHAIQYMQCAVTSAWNYINTEPKISAFMTLVFKICNVLLIS